MLNQATLDNIIKYVKDGKIVLYKSSRLELICQMQPDAQILVRLNKFGEYRQVHTYSFNDFIYTISDLVEENPFDWSILCDTVSDGSNIIYLNERRKNV